MYVSPTSEEAGRVEVAARVRVRAARRREAGQRVELAAVVVGHHHEPAGGAQLPRDARAPRAQEVLGLAAELEALGPAPGEALDDAEHALVDGDEVRVADLLRERRRRAVEPVAWRRPTTWSVPRCAISVAMARARR